MNISFNLTKLIAFKITLSENKFTIKELLLLKASQVIHQVLMKEVIGVNNKFKVHIFLLSIKNFTTYS